MGHCFIGISGWNYPTWRKVFYPPGLTHARELAYASRQFSTMEVNGSFYGLLRPSTCLRWYEETPSQFVFAVKGSRFITHMKRLRDAATPLANFFASGILALREKLGPILWQLPPAMAFDEQRLTSFFELLPRTLKEASKLAAKHDHRLEGRSHVAIDLDGELRHALEVRHPSFVTPSFIRLMRAQGIALCIAGTGGRWPFFEDVTADFVYVRLHGEAELYVSGYDADEISLWADRVEKWRRGSEMADAVKAAPSLVPRKRRSRDVYVYFDNDARVRAPFDARALADRLAGNAGTALPDLERKGEPARTQWPGWTTNLRRRKA